MTIWSTCLYKPTKWWGLGWGGGVHIDLLTPSLSTIKRLRPRLEGEIFNEQQMTFV